MADVQKPDCQKKPSMIDEILSWFSIETVHATVNCSLSCTGHYMYPNDQNCAGGSCLQVDNSDGGFQHRKLLFGRLVMKSTDGYATSA